MDFRWSSIADCSPKKSVLSVSGLCGQKESLRSALAMSAEKQLTREQSGSGGQNDSGANGRAERARVGRSARAEARIYAGRDQTDALACTREGSRDLAR